MTGENDFKLLHYPVSIRIVSSQARDINDILFRVAHGIFGSNYRSMAYHVTAQLNGKAISHTAVAGHTYQMNMLKYMEGFVLSLDEHHKSHRVQYCMDHINDDLSQYVFIDEKTYMINQTGHRYVTLV